MATYKSYNVPTNSQAQQEITLLREELTVSN